MRKNICMLLLSAAFASCTSESTETPEQPESLSVECYSRSADNNTKSLVKDFAMYVFSGSGNYEGVSNPVHVTYSDKWDFPSITLREPAQIHAFYPYTDNMDYTAIPLSLTPQTDYLTSVGAVTADKTNPSISIVMEHILSKINVTINSSANCKVTLSSVPATASYNLRSNNLLTKAESDVTSSTSSVLMFPTAEERQIGMKISYEGKTYSYRANPKVYESGKSYTYTLKINDDKELAIIGDVIITDWKAGGNYEGTVQ